MPTASKAKTIDEIYNEYLQHQLATGEIERSTYSNSIYSYNKYIKPYLCDYVFATIDKTVLSGWLTKLYQAGYSQNTIHTTYARLKKVYNYFYNNGELLKDPFKGVKMPKKGEAKVTHLNNDQMDNVLSAVYVDYEPQDPMYVGILLAFYAGSAQTNFIMTSGPMAITSSYSLPSWISFSSATVTSPFSP